MTDRRKRGSMADAAARQAPTEPQAPRGPVLRVKPYKATFDLPADDLREVRVWAIRHGLVGVAPVVRALIDELADNDSLSATVEAAIATGSQVPRDPVKTTFDLLPPTYRALKTWSAAHGTTGTTVLRVLLAALVADQDGAMGRQVVLRAMR